MSTPTPLEEKFSQMVFKLAKRQENDRLSISHMVIGIAGEAGEVFEHLKKYMFNGHKFNRELVIKELGDLEFYLEGLRQLLFISRYETLCAVMNKLAIRYGSDYIYSDEASQLRLDLKQEEDKKEEPQA